MQTVPISFKTHDVFNYEMEYWKYYDLQNLI